ncbi:hypothetical protein E2C01_075926 [Portunus trituberculatus]|uniref:Uncharacterized protein n=1 Tax=Portunus trituberculatus TaxID=210409 RepID=A0A5B7IHL9_PORTR|nr:hypothetical protein [Portunus trituberculatus]
MREGKGREGKEKKDKKEGKRRSYSGDEGINLHLKEAGTWEPVRGEVHKRQERREFQSSNSSSLERVFGVAGSERREVK